MSPGRVIVWTLFVALFVLHQDWWWWDDATLVLGGTLPVGLAWHAGFSIAAAALWLLAVKAAWPSEVEAWAEGDAAGGDAAGGDASGGDASEGDAAGGDAAGGSADAEAAPHR